MKYIPLAVGWTIAAVLIAVGWFDLLDSVTHENQALFPVGFMGVMFCLTGLGAGLAGNGISAALK